jgi:hypothetical protein
VIWALLFILLSGSNDSFLLQVFEEASSRIETVIEDKSRRKALGVIIKDAADATREFEKSRAKQFDGWMQMSRDGSAEVAAYESLFATMEEYHEVYQRTMIQLRGELRDRVSREEWERLFPGP